MSEKDQIRQIAKPDEGFEYKEFPKAKERWNERRREAYDGLTQNTLSEQ